MVSQLGGLPSFTVPIAGSRPCAQRLFNAALAPQTHVGAGQFRSHNESIQCIAFCLPFFLAYVIFILITLPYFVLVC